MPITTKLFGRLGNQMFQQANCIAFAARYGWDYMIPQRTTPAGQWPIYFTHFNPLTVPLTNFGFYRDQENHEYQPIPRREQLCFEGYFQSYLYFIDQWDKVEASFAPAFNFPELDKIDLMGRVSVHIRRGDYVELQSNHPPVSMEYIKTAMLHFISQGYPFFSIFSDDIDWCRQHITPDLLFPELSTGQINFHYMEPGKNVVKDALFDMTVMSRHEHNIISNSTFSYWAAMLNKNPTKQVVTPALTDWYGPALQHLSVKDLMPPAWIQMPATRIVQPGSLIETQTSQPLHQQATAAYWCHLEALGGGKCQQPCGIGGKCGQ